MLQLILLCWGQKTLVSGVGHGLKSASFNGVQKMWGKEPIEHKHRTGEVLTRKVEMSRQSVEAKMRYQSQGD